MFFFIYQTTNLINGKIYIGQHSTKKINDGYLGSGYRLKQAIKKYGRKNFKREILHFCQSHEELNDLERFIVDAKFVTDESNYNRAIGGDGGFSHHLESKQKISDAGKANWAKKSNEERKEIGNRISQSLAQIPEEEKIEIKARKSASHSKNWQNNQQRRQTQSKFLQTKMNEYWDNMSRDEYNLLIIKRKQAWQEVPDTVKADISAKKSAAWRSRSPEEIQRIIAKRIDSRRRNKELKEMNLS